MRTCNQALNQFAQEAILAALWLHCFVYSLHYEVTGGEQGEQYI